MRVRNGNVRIGDLVLGKQPVYCVTVLESTATAAAAAATAAMQAGADCLELRLDKLKDLSEVGALVRAVRSPAIGVCRRPKWDGFFEGSERERVSRLFKAIEEGIPAVDVDLITPPALRRDVIRAAKARGTTVMISYENFQRTPSAARLLQTVARRESAGRRHREIRRDGDVVPRRLDGFGRDARGQAPAGHSICGDRDGSLWKFVATCGFAFWRCHDVRLHRQR